MFAEITKKDYEIIKKLENGTSDKKRFAEMFKLMLIDNDFKNLVKKIRKKLNLPKDGLDFNNKKHSKIIGRFVESGGITANDSYVYNPFVSLDRVRKGCDEEVGLFLEQKNNYGLEKKYFYHNKYPRSLEYPINEYILFNDVIPTDTELISITRTFYREELESDIIKNPKFYKILKKDGLKPFVFDESITVSFSPYVTKKELLEYIERNWNQIELLRDSILGEKRTKKRIKSKKNFFRDVYIYQKFQEYKKTSSNYPELKVVSFLKKEHNIFLSEGTIRSVVSRINKIVSNKEG